MTTAPRQPADLRIIENLNKAKARLLAELHKVIIGQDEVIELLLQAILSRGHCLLVGVPGLAKTLMVSTLAEVLKLSFSRIQFTPDLMPSDVTGTEVIEEDRSTGRREFRFVKGPIFANIILADEINRAPAKVQSALLEAMQERQITIGETTHRLPDPFMVLATQNPIEQEGTYPLPEAQLDRFLFKIRVDYPSPEEERRVLEFHLGESFPKPRRISSLEELAELEDVARQVYLDDRIRSYIIALVNATRRPAEVGLGELNPLVGFGASPRASIALALGGRSLALIRGRSFVTPEDIKAIGPDVLRHRIILSYEAEAEEFTSDDLVQKIFDGVEVP